MGREAPGRTSSTRSPSIRDQRLSALMCRRCVARSRCEDVGDRHYGAGGACCAPGPLARLTYVGAHATGTVLFSNAQSLKPRRSVAAHSPLPVIWAGLVVIKPLRYRMTINDHAEARDSKTDRCHERGFCDVQRTPDLGRSRGVFACSVTRVFACSKRPEAPVCSRL
jgi:hypothetical protein